MLYLPEFPQTKALTLDDKYIIEGFTTDFEIPSDYNFVSLWGYNIGEDVTISSLFGNLIVRFRDYISNNHFYSFLGKNKLNETIDILFTKSKQEGLGETLHLISEECFFLIADKFSQLEISEDRNNFDYILSLKELESLEGVRYEKHRKEIARFNRSFPQTIISQLDLKLEETRGDIEKVCSVWKEKKQRSDEETQSEFTAIERTLASEDSFNLVALGIYDIKRLIGFCIADTSGSNCLQSHFLKSDPTYEGVKFVLHHNLAKLMYPKGYVYLNIEQDLGIEGLRMAKEKCRPMKYLKKYTIKSKT